MIKDTQIFTLTDGQQIPVVQGGMVKVAGIRVITDKEVTETESIKGVAADKSKLIEIDNSGTAARVSDTISGNISAIAEHETDTPQHNTESSK